MKSRDQPRACADVSDQPKYRVKHRRLLAVRDAGEVAGYRLPRRRHSTKATCVGRGYLEPIICTNSATQNNTNITRQ